MSSIWTAGDAELKAIAPTEGEYVAIVQLTRSIADDAEYAADAADAAGFAMQVARELQEAYDECGIAGRFQVIRVEA